MLSLLPLRVAGFASERVITYWLSFDPDSRMLKYGMGHHMEETTLLSCTLPDALGSLYRTCPKLVCLHGYVGPVQQRSLYETKLINAGGQRQVCTFRHNSYSKQLMVVSQPLAPTSLLKITTLGRLVLNQGCEGQARKSGLDGGGIIRACPTLVAMTDAVTASKI